MEATEMEMRRKDECAEMQPKLQGITSVVLKGVVNPTGKNGIT